MTRPLLGVALPRPKPLKATRSPLERRLVAQVTTIARRSPEKGRALERLQQVILTEIDWDEAHKVKRRA